MNKDLQADLEKCPILKDRAKNLTPEEVEKLRENYEKYIKPYFPTTDAAATKEENKRGEIVHTVPKIVSKPRHHRLKELRSRAQASGCPFLNSSMFFFFCKRGLCTT